MNKSKFLKKSLAVLLSVMMVVAMIPLGASAAWDLSTDAVGPVTTTVGTIEKTSTTAGTVKLPYTTNDADTFNLVLRVNGYETVKWTVDGTAKTDVTVASRSATLASIPATAKTVTFTPATGTTNGSTYTITVDKAVASRITTLKEAKLDGKIEGTINNTAKTVTFSVPWGYDGAKAVTAEMDYPSGTAPAYNSTAKTLTVTAQVPGVGDVYTVVINEASGLSAIAVNGVAATYDDNEKLADGTTNTNYQKWVVVLPTGTDLTKEVPVVFTSPAVSAAQWNADTAFKSGKKVIVNAGDNTLTLTPRAENTAAKPYTVNVSIAKNTDAAISSFELVADNDDTVNAGATGATYTAAGTISGIDLTATLPASADLTKVAANLVVGKGAKVSVAGGVDIPADADGKVSTAKLDLSEGKKVLITVTAEDNKTFKDYNLSATKVDNRNSSNTVDSLKMTIGTGDDAKDYSGVLSGTTFTFTVPYATTAANVKSAKFTGAYPSGSTVAPNPVAAPGDYADDDLKTPVTFKVTSETGREATYTIKFAKEAAKTGKTVSGVSFAKAAKADDVKAENTYAATVSGKKMTVTFPYSAEANKTPDYDNLVPQFTLPEGAKLYGNDGTVVESGFYTEEDEKANGAHKKGTPKSTIDLSDLAANAGYTFVVADEAAVFEMNKATGAKTLSEIRNDEENWAKHVTEITVDVKYAAAQNGYTLSGITGKETAKDKVTGAVSGDTLTITVPGSYVANMVGANAAVPFKVEWNVATLASVDIAANASLTVKDTGTKDDDDNTIYGLYVDTATRPTETVTVTSESGRYSREYDIVVKVNPVQTGALITAAKANDTTATVSNRDWTITATVPASTDLTKVKLTLTGSTMADVAVVGATSDTPATLVVDENGDSIADTYDLSDLEHPLRVKVVAEDGATKNYYTLVIKTEEISFTDVKSGDWFYDDVIAAATAGIVSGYPDKTYKPNNNIKRKDFAVMVASMMGADLSKYTTSAFSDVAHDYAEKAIAYCGETGIIAGKAPGKFAPNDFITREQAATIVARALKLQSTSATKFADDASISSWASSGVYACVAAGIIEGVGNNTFAPKKNLTRAQAARILVLALNQK